MQAYFETAALDVARAPVYSAEETVLVTGSNVSLYHGDVKVHQGGVAILTSHRILWVDDLKKTSVHLALSLDHLSAVHHKNAFMGSPKIVMELKDRTVPIPRSNPPQFSVVKCPAPGYAMLSFKGSERDIFLEKLRESIKEKAWKHHEQEAAKRQGPVQFSTANAGVNFVIQNAASKREKAEREVSQAFTDLKALMVHAKDMVALAERVAAARDRQRQRQAGGPASDAASDANPGSSGSGPGSSLSVPLSSAGFGPGSRSSSSASPQPDAMSEDSRAYDTLLVDMGLPNPVDRRTAGSTFHLQLSRQVAAVLDRPIRASGGMMSLAEAYCRYNRARGTDMVSPDDMLQACRLFSELGLPLRLRKFESGALVIETASHSKAGSAFLLLDLLAGRAPRESVPAESSGPTVRDLGEVPMGASLSALEVSQKLGMSIALAKMHLADAVAAGVLAVDRSDAGLRYHANWILVLGDAGFGASRASRK